MPSIFPGDKPARYCIQCGLVKPDPWSRSPRSPISAMTATFDVHEDPSDAATVLLSSGLGGAAGYWTPQIDALRQRYRIVAYDQAGTGRTGGTLAADHSIAAMADEAAGVLDASGTAAAHFVGHALGGLVGLALAQRRSDRLRSLTVVNGWAAAHAHTRRCFDVRLALLEHEGPAAYVKAQPIFLYPADWLARTNCAQPTRRSTGSAASRVRATSRRASGPSSPSMRAPPRDDQVADVHCRHARRRAGAERDVRGTGGRHSRCAPAYGALGSACLQRHAARHIQCVAARLSRLALSYQRNEWHRAT